jgi:imidazolonepropionase-like amidohydrolase
LGVLAPGKLADIGAMSGDPIVNIAATEKVDFVMKDGMVFRDDRRRSETPTQARNERKAA